MHASASSSSSSQQSLRASQIENERALQMAAGGGGGSVELAQYHDPSSLPDRRPFTPHAQTPLPVVLPPSARGGGGGNAASSHRPPLHLSIPSTPQAAAAASLRQSSVLQEEKQHNPLRSSAVSVRSSQSSLPPTRVASPSNLSAGGYAPFQAPQSSPFSPASASASSPHLAGIANYPSPSPTPTPASRRALGSTVLRSKIPVGRTTLSTAPNGSASKKPSTSDRLAACFSKPPPVSAIFGIPLSTLYATYARLPKFLDVCFDYLLLPENLSQCASFFSGRVSQLQLEEFVDYIEDTGEGMVSLQGLSHWGPDIVSAFLVAWVQQVPDPVVPFERYEQLLAAANFTPTDSNAAGGAFAPSHHPHGAPAAAHDPIPPALRAMFPSLTLGDESDRLNLVSSLVTSLPGAHWILLRRIVDLIERMVNSQSLRSPGPNGEAVSLQRVCAILASAVMQPQLSSSASATKSDPEAGVRRAREQQVLVYLVQHRYEIFERNAVRLISSVPPPVVEDINPQLTEEIRKWRTTAGNLRVKFGRRHFDDRALVRVFRAWRGMCKTNRRKAEAYRQLALLKQELLAEKQKNAALTRELYGLKEEYELRDFQDQLRMQTGSIGAHGYGITRVPIPIPSTGKGGYLHEEKEQAAGMSGPQGSAARAPRDLTADLASVRALQEQDRILTQTYSRYN